MISMHVWSILPEGIGIGSVGDGIGGHDGYGGRIMEPGEHRGKFPFEGVIDFLSQFCYKYRCHRLY